MKKIKVRKYITEFLNSIDSTIQYMSDGSPTEIKKTMPLKAYTEEFRTIRIFLPRRLGNSLLIKELYKKYMSMSIIFAPYSQVRNDLLRCIWIDTDKIFINCPTDNDFSPNIILVDCATCYKEGKLNKIYKTYEKSDPIYILIG